MLKQAPALIKRAIQRADFMQTKRKFCNFIIFSQAKTWFSQAKWNFSQAKKIRARFFEPFYPLCILCTRALAVRPKFKQVDSWWFYFHEKSPTEWDFSIKTGLEGHFFFPLRIYQETRVGTLKDFKSKNGYVLEMVVIMNPIFLGISLRQ